jgi:SAM-dependent methyltransferase
MREPTPKPDFNTLADAYAKFRTSYSRELFDVILSYARVPRGGRILDLACGTGLGMEPYVARGYEVCGVDVAPAMLEAARQVLGSRGSVSFAIGRAEQLPLADAAFDLVSCAQSFHWFEPHAAFAECARVLKPGGALAIFWKHAARGDALTTACEAIVRDWLGDGAMRRSRDHADEHESGWPVYWRYVAPVGEAARGRPFVEGRKDIIEFDLPRTAEDFIGYQRSREKIRTVLGARRDEFLAELERRLRARGPMEYVFLARKAG